MTNSLQPRKPQNRELAWSDHILDVLYPIRNVATDLEVYLVGGAVRDAFLQRPIKDLDLATPGNAIALARRMANHLDGDFYVMDAERDVARVIAGGDGDKRLIIDVAAFRDVDLLSDLRGRDFTINAMAVDIIGDWSLLIDPLGGERDALVKALRRCTEQSISDDPIRGLRAIRQSVQLGFRIDPDTVSDIRQYGKNLLNTSSERVRDEFFSLLALPKARMALRVAHALGLLEIIIPEISTLQGQSLWDSEFDAWHHTLETVEHLSKIMEAISYRRTDHTAASFRLGILAMQLDRFRAELNVHLDATWTDGRTTPALVAFAAIYALMNPAGADPIVLARRGADDLRLSNTEKQAITTILKYCYDAQTVDHHSDLMRHRYWHQAGKAGIDACILGLALYLSRFGTELHQDDWLEQIERAVLLLEAYFLHHDTLVAPSPLVTGDDLIAAFNLKPGPIIGELLTMIREGQVMQEIQTQEQALTAVQTYLDQA